jgi:SAM-dependent methyltransferase
MLGALMAAVLVPATGLWLGGYPGAVIAPAATLLAMAIIRYPAALGYLLAGLMLAGTALFTAGHRLQLTGHAGPLVTALDSAAPQVAGVAIIGCLIAMLLYRRNAYRRNAGPARSHRSHGRQLAAVGEAWRTLSEEDPLWAILVTPQAKGGRWDVAEFYATGEAEVLAALARAAHYGLPASGARALDFGCGAGRLTRALAAEGRYELVTGIDIAPDMLELARRDNPVGGRCRFLLNDRPDLALLPDGELDLVYTTVVLQHMPRPLIRWYLTEFARVLRPGGTLIFQLPTRPKRTPRGLAYRLPPAAIAVIQRRLLGYPAPMQMHGLPERKVRRLLAAHGIDVIAQDPAFMHPDWLELRYFCRKRGPATEAPATGAAGGSPAPGDG